MDSARVRDFFPAERERMTALKREMEDEEKDTFAERHTTA